MLRLSEPPGPGADPAHTRPGLAALRRSPPGSSVPRTPHRHACSPRPPAQQPPHAQRDAIWKRGKSDETAEALRSIVNAGHRRSATVGRVEMNGSAASLIRFPVYAPDAIAGIGTLPDTTRSWTGPSWCGCAAGHRTSGCGTTGSGPPAPKVTPCASCSPSGPPMRLTGLATRGRRCRPGWPTARPMCGNRCSWSRTLRPGGLAQQLTGHRPGGDSGGYPA